MAEVGSPELQEGPTISLASGPEVELLKAQLTRTYQEHAIALRRLRVERGHQPPESVVFAPLRYRIGLLGTLLTEGHVRTHELSRWFDDQDHILYPQVFQAACEEVAHSVATASPH